MKQPNIPEFHGVSFRAESVLGEGGTAQVFKVRSSADDKAYALKRIAKSKSEKRNKRFRKEIEFGMASNNSHVVKIYEHAEDSDYFYYTMGLYPKSLRDVIREESDTRVLLDYLSQLCDGLAYVHAQGVVHRDIKPENILVDIECQRLVLADFGIAHFKDSLLTTAHEVLANRNYQAPEQMMKKDASRIGSPADIFALGLIFTEVFTKENSRGVRHLRVSDIHPHLSDLDKLIEGMMLQDEAQRIEVEVVRDWLHLIRRQNNVSMEEIADGLRYDDETVPQHMPELDSILEQASTDILSAKHIFERSTDEELKRYNWNYHSEISYRVSDELYNSCVQSQLYSMTKAMFEYEANGAWNDLDMELVLTPHKVELLNKFKLILAKYPLPRNSIWSWLPNRASHYFRFCKDYHCDEIIARIDRLLSLEPDSHGSSFHQNLMNAPIIWLAASVRGYLADDVLKTSPDLLAEVELDRHVRVNWQETVSGSPSRKAIGSSLFGDRIIEEKIDGILGNFMHRWDVSAWERPDRRYSIYFRSVDEYTRFSNDAHAFAASHHSIEAEVFDLLTSEDQYDDFIVLSWDSFDIQSTLAKVLHLREV